MRTTGISIGRYLIGKRVKQREPNFSTASKRGRQDRVLVHCGRKAGHIIETHGGCCLSAVPGLCWL